MDGNMDDMVHAMQAIKMIDEGAQTLKLTERVKEFLESVYRKEE
jgi:exosome complex RNA-binding protein Rrp4